MPRCGRCGTIYSEGARYCPKCGEPERAERGLFRAPRPDSSPAGEIEEIARKQRGGFFSVPLPFAVFVAGILMNPAVPQWIFKIYLFAAPALGLDASSPSRAAIVAINYAPSLCGMCVALHRARRVDAPPQGKPPSAHCGGRDFHADARDALLYARELLQIYFPDRRVLVLRLVNLARLARFVGRYDERAAHVFKYRLSAGAVP